MSDINAIDKHLEKGRQEMQDAFYEAVKPIHQVRRHMKVIVEQGHAEALEGSIGIPLNPPD